MNTIKNNKSFSQQRIHQTGVPKHIIKRDQVLKKMRDIKISKQKETSSYPFSEPQGAVFSIEHKHTLNTGICDMLGSSKDFVLGMMEQGPMSLFTKFAAYSGSAELWCLAFLACLSAEAFGRKSATLRAVKFFNLTMFVIHVISDATNSSDMKAKAFWASVYPYFEHMRKDADENPMEEIDINMDEVLSTPQGGDDYVPMTTDIMLACLTYVSGMHAKQPLASAILGFSKINPLQRANVGSMIISFVNLTGELFKSLKLKKLSEYFHIEEFTELDYSEFAESVGMTLTSMNTGSMSSDTFYVAHYNVLLKQGAELIKRAEKGSYDEKTLLSLMVKLRNAHQAHSDLKASLSGTRQEPVGILFRGDPAVAKTTLTLRSASVLTRAICPEPWVKDFEKDEGDFIFHIPEDKFMDTYGPKCITTVLDDIFQVRDTVGDTESDACKVMSMINTDPMPLHMSTTEEKNKVFYRSSIFLASTNIKDFSGIVSITSTKALARRFIIVDVVVKDKYKTNGKVDVNKLPRCDVTVEGIIVPNCTYHPEDLWDLSLVNQDHDPTNATSVPSEPITFDDLMVKAMDAHEEKVRHFFVNKEKNRSISERLHSKLKSRRPESMSDLTLTGSFRERLKRDNDISRLYSMPQASYEDSEFSDSVYAELDSEYLVQRTNKNITSDFDTGEDIICLHGTNCLCQHIKSVPEHMRVVIIRSAVSVIFSLPTKYSHHMDDYIKFFCTVINSDFHFRQRLNQLFIDGEWAEFFFETSRLLHTRLNFNQDLLTGESAPKTASELFRDAVDKKVVPILKFIEENKIIIILGITLLGGSIYAITKQFTSFIPNDTEDYVSTPHSVDEKRQSFRVGKRPLVKTTRPKQSKSQGIDVNSIVAKVKIKDIDDSIFGANGSRADIQKIFIGKQLYIVEIVRLINGEENIMRLGHAINIGGKEFMMPYHFAAIINAILNRKDYEGGVVVLVTTTNSQRISLTMEEFADNFYSTSSCAEQDICGLHVPSANPSAIGALKYFVTVADYENYIRNSTMNVIVFGTYVIRNEGAHHGLALRSENTVGSFTAASVLMTWPHDKEDGDSYEVEHAMRYKGSFGAGDCGSPMFISNSTNGHRMVMGMHVAGGTNYGESTIITQELITDLRSNSRGDNVLFVSEAQSAATIDTELSTQGLLQPIATLKPAYIAGEIYKSDYKKSVFYGKLPKPFDFNVKFPSRQKPFVIDEELIDPRSLALNKYAKYPTTITEWEVAQARDSYEILITRHMDTPRNTRGVLTVEQALHAYKHLGKINSSTSSGFPMSLNKDTDYKKLYYAAIFTGDKVESNKYLDQIAKTDHELITSIKAGIRQPLFFKDCLKDELRSLEKVKAGKTRMFSACPFTLLVAIRRYFGEFISSFTESRFNVGSAVGCNVYSMEWHDLARRLSTFATKRTDPVVGAGDYSAFDTNQFPIVLEAILNIILGWYGVHGDQTDNDIREALWVEITNSQHIFGDKVYSWNTGMPSGCPLTTVINTMYNNLVFRLAFSKVASVSLFNTHVILIAYGDDNTFTVSDKYSGVFNEMTIPVFMKEFGQTYTTELKVESVVMARPVTEVGFLKRSFRFDEKLNRFVAPIEMESIFGCLHWTRKGPEDEQISADMVTSAFRELSLHGEDVFNEYVPQLMDMLEKYLPGVQPNGTYSSRYSVIYEETISQSYFL